MKIIVLTLSLTFSILLLHGQSQIDSLVSIGISYHDKGEYNKAIDAYNQALAIDPNSTTANYELAMTYMYSGDYEQSIKYCDIVINQNNRLILPAYITKGSSLDNLGKTNEAIELFKKAVNEYGNHYLLQFNLGITYMKMNNLESAESAFVSAIEDNSKHASSHLNLAFLKKKKNERLQSLLGLFYFLMLEPNSKRSELAYTSLMQLFDSYVQAKGDDKKLDINIYLNSDNANSEFYEAELILGMVEATNLLATNKNKSAEELFMNKTNSFFTILGELAEKKEHNGLYWNFYVPFFYELSKSEHAEAYCWYISLSSNENSQKWVKSNTEKVDNLKKWFVEISKQ